MRICSFLPSATEIVYALGLDDSLYGVSHECDFPAEAKSKPRVVKSKFDPAHYTSQEIDRLVADMVARGERIYQVDVGVLKRARPDLVITQELCDVCAISYEDVQSAVVHLDMPPQLISLDPTSLGDVMRDIERLGEATGKATVALELTARLRERIQRVQSQASEAASRPKVACIEWLDPLIVAGHWIPEMVEMAGGIDALAQPGSLSRRIRMEELVSSAPEVLVLMPCGMDVTRTIRELSLLGSLDQWKTLPAVQLRRVYAVDAGGLFSRSGPRLMNGLELLAQMIHPDLFPGPLAADSARRLEELPVSS